VPSARDIQDVMLMYILSNDYQTCSPYCRMITKRVRHIKIEGLGFCFPRGLIRNQTCACKLRGGRGGGGYSVIIVIMMAGDCCLPQGGLRSGASSGQGEKIGGKATVVGQGKVWRKSRWRDVGRHRRLPLGPHKMPPFLICNYIYLSP